jgi:UDP-N-acetylglucosamine--N-acetylmuramyl-(pentapeptide) pyrophosphoryl-undecaprenol N-acetylglucosamine transferase
MVVSRAGAMTVSELAALGKPSLLIPYPHAANNHQETNALTLVRAGGAEMILEKKLDGERLADTLLRYMDDREALMRMGRNAKQVGMLHAAKIIVDQLLTLIRRSP